MGCFRLVLGIRPLLGAGSPALQGVSGGLGERVTARMPSVANRRPYGRGARGGVVPDKAMLPIASSSSIAMLRQ